jgi:hypothetical protein
MTGLKLQPSEWASGLSGPVTGINYGINKFIAPGIVECSQVAGVFNILSKMYYKKEHLNNL